LTKDKKRLSYFQAVLRILEAGTYSTSGVIIITPDNHEGCSDCLGFGITSGLLIQTYNAIGGDAGIYGHPQIAISVAGWVSSEFEAWAGYTLLLVLNGEFKPLTEEAKQAEKELQVRWEKIRSGTIVTRRELTDAIKEYLETNEVSENYRKFVYSNCSDKINRSLFGKTASKLCAERSCDRDELRSTHSAASLVLIDRIEGHAVRLIDRGMEPQIAVTDAIDFYS
jgi:hypothetical protein